MNINGIRLLRKLGLPGPRNEVICRDTSDINLDTLYDGAPHGATIIAFDDSEPLKQISWKEKEVRRLRLKKEDFLNVLQEVVLELRKKGVKDVILYAHQTYTPEDICCSGRIILNRDEGWLLIDAVKGLRPGRSDFTPSFIYRCPLLDNRPVNSEGRFIKKEYGMPERIFRRIVHDVLKVPGNANIDFEVYKDREEVFYHDMFME